MPVILKITTTKPDGVEFYGRSSPEAAVKFLKIEAWLEKLPGFLGHTQAIVDSNTRAQEIKFDTLENYNNYQVQKDSVEEWVDRAQYNQENGITVDWEEIVD